MKDYDKLLRKEVEKIFGQQITNATHCEQLSEVVLNATAISISAQTFRRYWGIIDYKNKVSVQSKNALCKYVGYADYNDFIAKSNNTSSDIAKSIDFNIIQQFFQNNKMTEKNYELWNEGVTSVLAQIIFSDQQIFASFVQKLHKNPYAMDYIIGLYQCYHLLSEDWYMKGLRIFCNHSPISHHTLYLYSMECMALLLGKDIKEMKIWIAKILHLRPKVRKEYGIIYPLEGAIDGLLIIYYHQTGNMDDKNDTFIQSEKIIQEKTISQNEYGDTIASFVLHLIETLVWAGLYDDAYDFLQKYGLDTKQYKYYQATVTQSVYIYKALIYLFHKQDKKAQNLLEKINIAFVRFDAKPTLSSLLLLLQYGIASKTAKLKREKLKTALIKMCNLYGFENIKSQIPLFE